MTRVQKNVRNRRLSLMTAAVLGLPLATGIPAANASLDVDQRTDQIAFVDTAATNDGAAESADPLQGWQESDLAAYATWWDAGYNYEQLVALTEEWGVSEFEAKARAGGAILNGDSSGFEQIVEGIEARVVEVDSDSDGSTFAESSPEAFWSSGYDYEDAVVLADEWNLGTPWEAKVAAADLIDNGQQDEVAQVLADS